MHICMPIINQDNRKQWHSQSTSLAGLVMVRRWTLLPASVLHSTSSSHTDALASSFYVDKERVRPLPDNQPLTSISDSLSGKLINSITHSHTNVTLRISCHPDQKTLSMLCIYVCIGRVTYHPVLFLMSRLGMRMKVSKQTKTTDELSMFFFNFFFKFIEIATNGAE